MHLPPRPFLIQAVPLKPVLQLSSKGILPLIHHSPKKIFINKCKPGTQLAFRTIFCVCFHSHILPVTSFHFLLCNFSLCLMIKRSTFLHNGSSFLTNSSPKITLQSYLLAFFKTFTVCQVMRSERIAFPPEMSFIHLHTHSLR